MQCIIEGELSTNIIRLQRLNTAHELAYQPWTLTETAKLRPSAAMQHSATEATPLPAILASRQEMANRLHFVHDKEALKRAVHY